MENIENEATTTTAEAHTVSISDLMSMAAHRWWWFVISVVITLGVAVLYLMSTPPQYTRSASVLIKDDKAGGMSNSMIDLSELGISPTSANIQNELQTISSPTLMAEVVDRLDLNDSYSYRTGLRTNTLYKSSPVLVTVPETLENETFGFDFVMTADSTVEMSNFYNGPDELAGEAKGRPGQTVKTPVGELQLVRPKWSSTLEPGTKISFAHSPARRAADGYSAKLNASLGNDKATIITLSITDPSVARADDILLNLIDVYNERWILDRNQIANSTSRFIDDRLGVIVSELGNVDSDISSYKSEHLLPDVQSASTLYMNQSAENRRLIDEINTQAAVGEQLRAALSHESISEPLPVSTGLQSSDIVSSIEKYNEAVLERNRLLASSSERNPVVRDATTSLQMMKSNILASVDTYLASLRTQLQSLRRRESATAGQIAASPNQAKYLLSVERQQKVKEALYLFLLQKREENELSQAFTAYNTRVIDTPWGPASPTSPRTMVIFALALVVGLAIPLGIIYLLETFNTRIRGRKDLESISAPFVGEVPLYKGKGEKGDKGSDSDIVVAKGRLDVINEAFRVIRTNITFMDKRDQGCQVLIVTSFNPHSGKSFIVANLGMSLAIKGKKVLLIDGDMRHASTSKLLHHPDSGLSSYLAGAVENVKSLIHVYPDCPDLSILPVGAIPPNPTELLEDSRFSKMLDELRKDYDYIIIDCPPIDIVADTQIISGYADRTIFVVRAGLLERSMLPELNTIYREKRFNNMTVLLNGTTSGSGRYSYHYGYARGRYYGYYGSKE